MPDDYIPRSDVLQIECDLCLASYCKRDYKCVKAIRINNLPAADVEPKRKSGRWIIAGAFEAFYQCPECGEMWPIFSTIEWKCCPICECKIITNRPKGEDNE